MKKLIINCLIESMYLRFLKIDFTNNQKEIDKLKSEIEILFLQIPKKNLGYFKKTIIELHMQELLTVLKNSVIN